MAAGSVIMGCHHEQDMNEYGGLWRKMPLTFVAYFFATFAIAGVPGLSGFFSKDAILWTVFSGPHGHLEGGDCFRDPGPLENSVGRSVCLPRWTAFYMTRSLVLTFAGSYRGHAHPHESPWVVTLPVLILGLLSIVGGVVLHEVFFQYLAEWTRGDMLPKSPRSRGRASHSRTSLDRSCSRRYGAFSTLVFTKPQI